MQCLYQHVGWKKTKSKDHFLPTEKGMDVYFHNSKLNFLYPRMLCTKFGWKWFCNSWEDVNVFAFISTWKKMLPFIDFSILKHALCQAWLILPPWFRRKKNENLKSLHWETDRQQVIRNFQLKILICQL